MSTWAARLSTGSKSPVSRNTSNHSTPFFGPQSSPSPPPGMGSFSLTHSPTAATAATTTGSYHMSGKTAKQLVEEAEAKALKEEFRQIAEMHNADTREVPALRLPNDAWEFVTCFLTYADVVQLAHTSRRLWSFLMKKESIWEQQLRFFHEDILDMRGGSLLMTSFAIPSPSAGGRGVAVVRCDSSPSLSACHRFWQEKRLYVLDAHREWHFKELASLEDKDTGIFTVPLHVGQETLASAAAAPLSRPSNATGRGGHHLRSANGRGMWDPTPFHDGTSTAEEHISHAAATATAVSTPPLQAVAATAAAAGARAGTGAVLPSGDEGIAGLRAAQGTSGGPSSPALSSSAAAATVRMPMVGSPFVGPHRGDLHLKIYRPIRPGEKMLTPAPPQRLSRSGKDGGVPATSEEAADREGGAPRHEQQRRPPGQEVDETDEEEGEADDDSDAAAQSTELFFPTATPATREDEEAALAYVLALSEAEAKGLPPPPPPMYRRSITGSGHNVPCAAPARGDGGASGLGASRSPFSSGYGAASPSPHPQQQQQQQPCLKPSELMTVVEMINAGTMERSRIPIRDVTQRQSERFLRAMEETLKGAKRRRLHLGNHHRAVLNNGQTTRHRSGRPRPPQEQREEPLNAFATGGGTPPQPLDGRDRFPPTPSAALVASSPTVAAEPAAASGTPSMAAALDMVMAADGPTARLLFTDPLRSPPLQAAAAPPPPPPVNRMLKHFTGKLVEITKREAYAVCNQLMGLPEIIDDFCIFHSFGGGSGGVGAPDRASPRNLAGSPGPADVSSSNVPAMNRAYPRTRFFLIPELAPHGFIGMIIVDVVRVLVAVEKDRANRDESNTDWELEEGRMHAGRLIRPGQGYNAQYYARDEMRPL